jgi:DNA polymerase III subunit delta'
MAFSEIIGQKNPLATLRLALANNRMHHAYLFTGPAGVGKRTTALAVAMALHCAERNGDFCGHCAECARIQARNHPDVREIEPMTGKKEISIQQIREMEKELHYRSFSGGRKIAIIDPATLLNHASQNALLKTLEEPPRDSLLILISPSAGALLPTLRSRCLRLNFAPISPPLLVDFLVSKKGQAPKEAEFLAALSMGSMGAALEMDGNESRKRRRQWSSALSALTAGNYQGAMEAAEAHASSREEALAFLEWAESWYRDLLTHGLQQNALDVVNLDMLAELRRQAAEATVGGILSAATHAASATRKIQRNLNRRMVLEEFLLGVVGSQ